MAERDAPTRRLVDLLDCYHVEIHADTLAAHVHFPELAGRQELTPSVDQKADPLEQYRDQT